MLLLPLYALFVWYCCFRWRRKLPGMVALAFGEALVLTLLMIEHRFQGAGESDTGAFSNLSLLLAGEAVMVAGLGIFLWVLPRSRAEIPCRKCGYELQGLEHASPTCPECGTTAKPA